MPETTLRYLTMLKRIPAFPGRISAPSLCDHLAGEGFEVSLRTVQRDLKHLSAIFPLTSDEPAKPAGWSWTGGVEDLPSMAPHTALAFVLAQRFLEPLLPRATLAYLKPHIERAEAILGKLGRSGLGAWPAKVRVLPRGQRLHPAHVEPRVQEVIYEALLSGRRFSACYRPRGAVEPVVYEVNPLGLVFRDAVIYLVATLWGYDDVKQLALHRFSEAQLAAKRVRVPPDFELDAYLASGAFAYPLRPGRTIRLVALFDAPAAQHLYETPLDKNQRLVEQGDGRMRLQATVTDSNELRWWLLGFGDQVEVLKPVGLRREFARVAQTLHERYEQHARTDNQ